MHGSGRGRVLFAAACGLFLSVGWTFAARPADKGAAPSLSCAGATGLSIALQVCAGPAGAPSGFSLQWTTTESFAAGPDGLFGTSDDNAWPETDASGICTASLVGRARFRDGLGPNRCVTVDVGQLLGDSGASTNCSGSLQCGTGYVFRTETRGKAVSAAVPLSPDLFCSTLRCSPAVSGCTVTARYWRDHGPVPTRANAYEWGVDSLTLGTVTYSSLDLQAILETPAEGNGLLALAHQLIAAKLNIANGTDDADVAGTVAVADKVIGDLVVPPGGSGYLTPDSVSGITQGLLGYNEGAIGPGHCD